MSTMDTLLYFFLILLAALFVLLTHNNNNKNKKKNLPPSPLSLPILGHLHLIKKPLYRTLATISNRYGPILFLWFGSRPVLVVSSPSLVEECLTKNDVVFANRPRIIFGKHLGYNFTTLAWSPYGHNWRNLRRVTNLHIFSSNGLEKFHNIHADVVRSMIRRLISGSSTTYDHDIHGAAGYHEYQTVEMKQAFFELFLNIMARVMAGKRYYCDDEDNDEETRNRFREILKETFDLATETNIVDFLPFLRWVGFNGIEKRIIRLKEKREVFLQELIEERRRMKSTGRQQDTDDHVDNEESYEKMCMIDALLSQQQTEPDYYTDQMIRGVIGLLMSSGTDAPTVTIEWVMSVLLNNPEVLKKAQAEIDIQVGPHRLVNESDLTKLPYLRSIILETLRIYPIAPILVPHESSEECIVGGYNVPRGTMLLVNLWDIQNDPKLWDEPSKFKPERFEGLLKGGNREGFKLMPFGSGRRACPGEAFGMRVIGLALGSLIQCLEWKRVNDDEMVDMSPEGSGIILPKARPLQAKCRPRPTMLNFLTQL